MHQELALEKLFTSIHELEKSVVKVQTTFENRDDIPAQVFSRLDSYKEIVEKQKGLWFELEAIFSGDDKAHTAQIVIKINALSTLLLEDIRSVIASLDGKAASAEEESLLN